MISAALIREYLDYFPETGILIWRPRDRRHFKSSNQYKNWNSRYPGKRAGRIAGKGHRVVAINDKLYFAHRLAWLHFYGEHPSNMIDHINGDPDNNSIENLRVVTNVENSRNTSISKINSTGRTGVSPYFFNGRAKYVARIRVNGDLKHLGYFETVEEAAIARALAEKEFGFHQNHGRQKPKSQSPLRSRGFAKTRQS